MIFLAGESGYALFLRYVIGYKLYERAEFWVWVILLGPPIIITILANKIAKEESIKANEFLVLLSAFVPLLGLICYFARRDVDKNSAEMYLWCGVVSFIVNLILQFIFT